MPIYVHFVTLVRGIAFGTFTVMNIMHMLVMLILIGTLLIVLMMIPHPHPNR